MREEGLNEEEIKLGEDLHYRRANFQVDKYVKMCEVREIVGQALSSILDRMRKAEEIARKNRTEITVIDSRLKTHTQQIGHLKRLENGQSTLIRMQKDQELKLVEIKNTVADWKYEQHVKKEERTRLDYEIKRDITLLNGETKHL